MPAKKSSNNDQTSKKGTTSTLGDLGVRMNHETIILSQKVTSNQVNEV